MTEEILKGGAANAGAVIRCGETVTRPAPRNAEVIHRFRDSVASTRWVVVSGEQGAIRPWSGGIARALTRVAQPETWCFLLLYHKL